MTIDEKIVEAARQGDLAELTVRVSRYEKNRPVAWQAIAKYKDCPKGPWGVGVRSCPVAAINAALDRKTILTSTLESVCHGDTQLQTEDPFA